MSEHVIACTNANDSIKNANSGLYLIRTKNATRQVGVLICATMKRVSPQLWIAQNVIFASIIVIFV